MLYNWNQGHAVDGCFDDMMATFGATSMMVYMSC